MAGHLLKGLRAAAFMSITIVALAGGCSRSHPIPEGATAASQGATETSKDATAASKGATQAPNDVSQALIGKQITIRGKLLWGKPGPYILLDNQQEVFLIPDLSSGPFTWGPPYSEMEGKLVAATGVLRFHHVPEDAPRTDNKGRLIDRGSSYFYFNLKATQLRLIGPQ